MAQMGGFVDKGVTRQVSVQPPSRSSHGEIQGYVRMKKWLKMGLPDQILTNLPHLGIPSATSTYISEF